MKLRNVIFYVKDLEKSKDFYHKLGFEMTQDFGSFISYKTDDDEIYFSLNSTLTEDRVPGRQVCVFWTEDIEAGFEKMKELGVEFVEELYEAPFGRTFSIRDIDGNKIEYVEKK